ncbi:MAG: DUF6242 domain-containing protein [Paludibacteraceae bacterium]|nr:DUF6242 domain-containing protein [Paludibacteraceae bacterium]
MNKSKIFLYVAVMASGLALMTLIGCKKGSTNHDVQISAFSFQTSTLAPDIRSTTFIVDTLNKIIYNVDSLAFTDDLTKQVPVVSCFAKPDELRINDVSWNQVDSVDVSNPFKLTVVSSDKKIVNDYKVTVIKHKVDANQITWTSYSTNMPADGFNGGKVMVSDYGYLFVGVDKSSKTVVYTSENGSSWTKQSESGVSLNLSTLFMPINFMATSTAFAVGTDKCLYIMNADTYLFEKADVSLTDGYTLTDIIGEYEQTVLLLAVKDNMPAVFGYAEGTVKLITQLLPAGFPIKGNTAKCTVLFDEVAGENTYASYLIGGESATGLVQGVYSEDDGIYWTNVIKNTDYCFPPLKNASAVWYDKRLFVYGGQLSDGSYTKGYHSFDSGFSWTALTVAENLPSDCELAYNISAVHKRYDDYMYIFGGYTTNGTYKFQCYKGIAIHKSFIIQ